MTYDSEIDIVDFTCQRERTVTWVNAWVRAKTENIIPRILSPGSIKPTDVLIVLNASYFKGSLWRFLLSMANTKQSLYRNGHLCSAQLNLFSTVIVFQESGSTHSIEWGKKKNSLFETERRWRETSWEYESISPIERLINSVMWESPTQRKACTWSWLYRRTMRMISVRALTSLISIDFQTMFMGGAVQRSSKQGDPANHPKRDRFFRRQSSDP